MCLQLFVSLRKPLHPVSSNKSTAKAPSYASTGYSQERNGSFFHSPVYDAETEKKDDFPLIARRSVPDGAEPVRRHALLHEVARGGESVPACTVDYFPVAAYHVSSVSKTSFFSKNSNSNPIVMKHSGIDLRTHRKLCTKNFGLEDLFFS